jgi:hypothetical protein
MRQRAVGAYDTSIQLGQWSAFSFGFAASGYVTHDIFLGTTVILGFGEWRQFVEFDTRNVNASWAKMIFPAEGLHENNVVSDGWLDETTPELARIFYGGSDGGVIGGLGPQHWDFGSKVYERKVSRGTKNGKPIKPDICAAIKSGGFSTYRFSMEGGREALGGLNIPMIVRTQPDGTEYKAEDVDVWLACQHMPVLVYVPGTIPFYCPERHDDVATEPVNIEIAPIDTIAVDGTETIVATVTSGGKSVSGVAVVFELWQGEQTARAELSALVAMTDGQGKACVSIQGKAPSANETDYVVVGARCSLNDREVDDYEGILVAVVNIQILEPDQQPVTDNNFTFDNTPTGVCCVAASGATGVAALDDGLQWDVDAISGSTLTTNPADRKGPAIHFIFSGLPSLNGNFGNKKLTLTYPPCPGKYDTEVVQIFFDGSDNATNHLGPGAGTTPNWFFYWQQTSAGYGAPKYDPSFGLGQTRWENNVWVAVLGADNNDNYIPPPEPEGDNAGVPLNGIDHFAWVCRHEAFHVATLNV